MPDTRIDRHRLTGDMPSIESILGDHAAGTAACRKIHPELGQLILNDS